MKSAASKSPSGHAIAFWISLLTVVVLILAPHAAQAAITYFASASNPADGNNASRDGTTVAVTPPGSMVAGDLVIMVASARESGQTLAVLATGGQSWTAQTANTTNTTQRIFWARFNGAWSANPSVSFPKSANATSVSLHVFRPSNSANLWALDVAQTNSSFSAPASPYDVTIPQITTLSDGALVFAVWTSADNNTWAVQTAGWSNAGSAQYRNADGNDGSHSARYRIQTLKGATGAVTNRQTGGGPDPGNTSILAFRETSPPTVVKTFSPDTVPTNSNSTLTITLTNPNTGTAINGIGFVDTYPSVNLKNASTPGLSNTCGGTATGSAGASQLTLSGGTLAAGSSCTLSIAVTPATAGSYLNSTGTVTSTNAPSGAAASATLTALGPPTVAKSFSPSAIAVNGTSLLTITLTNPNATPITGAAFTDTYPANLTNAATPAATTSCTGGVVTAAGGGNALVLSGGTIPANSSCTVTVNVTVAQAGSYLNSTGVVTTSNAGNAAAATATLTVEAASTCFGGGFSDDFNRANGSPGSNWNVGYRTGTFGAPIITGNRLRLTDNTTGSSTWATLLRTFPAANNMITVTFDQLAYGGTNADGTAVVFSDASVGAQAGAFGGSLGYAQKSNPGSDCTTVGGCPGFTGGWLGVALDEFGNFSTNTEGRYGGGSSPVPNSVAIRGSGTGLSGYRFLTGTGSLSPGLSSATPLATPHRYRISIDHRDGNHVYTLVERSLDGGASYSTLLGPIDVKDPGFSQNPIPTNFTLSFTGSTGGNTNIHEIDNLLVCTAVPQVTPLLHHIKIEHGGTACTSTPASITLKACANAACDSLYQGSVTVALSNVGTWAPVSPITFSGGQTTITLAATVGSKTLATTSVAPTPTNGTECYNGGTQTCTITFGTCTYEVIEPGAAAGTPIYTKLTGAAFNLDVLDIRTSGGSQTPTAVALVDASSGTCSTFTALQASSTANTSIAAGARKTYSFTYNNAAPNVRVRVTTAGPSYSCSSDNFAIRPQSFSLTSSATYPANPPLKAGTDFFSITATATSATAYTYAPKVNGSLVTSPQGTAGALSSFLFPPATGGISQAGNPPNNGFTYSEVGTFNLSQYAVYDDTFAAVDSVKGECTPDFNNGPAVSSRFGCLFGSNSAGPFGRFTPDHFDTTIIFVPDPVTPAHGVPMSCVTGLTCPVAYNGMVYSGQVFKVTVTAKNGAGGTTVNYDTTKGFSKATTLSAVNGKGGSPLPTAAPGGTLGVTTLAATAFENGIATLSTQKFTFADVATAPTNIYIRAIDTDNVSSLRPTAAASVEGGIAVVGGRMMVENMYGPPCARLSARVRALYWDGSTWRLNDADHTSGNATGNLNITGGATLQNASGTSGIFTVMINPPATTTCPPPTGGSSRVSTTLSSDLSYLPGSGRETWGTFRAPHIYQREW